MNTLSFSCHQPIVSLFLVEEVEEALELLLGLLRRPRGPLSGKLLLRLPQVLRRSHRGPRGAAAKLVAMHLPICVESLLRAIGVRFAALLCPGWRRGPNVFLFHLGKVDVVTLDAVLRGLRRVRLLGLGGRGARLRMLLAHAAFLAEAHAYFRDRHDSVVDVHFRARRRVMLLPHQVLQGLRIRDARRVR